MASALLAGRNDVHHRWAEAGVPLIPKPPNPRRHLPNPNPSPLPPQPPPTAATAETSPSGHMTYRPSAMSSSEARALRARLAGELGQVRALLSRIDTWQEEEEERRRRSPPPPCRPLPPALRVAMLKKCSQILTKLRRHKQSVWFNAPVDVVKLGLHDYHAIIKKPMDLGTVKSSLTAGRYPSHDAFAADVRLTFSNALRYNPVGHQVHAFANNLLASFEQMYSEAVSWFDLECQHLEPPTPMSLPPMPVPMQAQAQAQPGMGSVKRPNPKAMEMNKREMSKEERKTLGAALEDLPDDKMEAVLQIVKRRNVGLTGDVIELDIDELDIETLWELDQFVIGCKKELDGQAAMMTASTAGITVAAVAEDNAVLTNAYANAPMVVDIGDLESDMLEKRSRVDEPVDEYVDIGDEMPTADYQSVEIEKDAGMESSSSGSGSSSSSSSGSESGNSGDSDSDGDNAQSPTLAR